MTSCTCENVICRGALCASERKRRGMNAPPLSRPRQQRRLQSMPPRGILLPISSQHSGAPNERSSTGLPFGGILRLLVSAQGTAIADIHRIACERFMLYGCSERQEASQQCRKTWGILIYLPRQYMRSLTVYDG